ncbi:unnamed protein product [Cylicocyclus nassatus]|uniref:Uncharacterized protein n=1 Tax=Cylicocyclus nassatus TaxID=53992 RepID=A0AA36GIK4_CYLNA|nr:unnamed protein product [Cylicocyclus nassatus]
MKKEAEKWRENSKKQSRHFKHVFAGLEGKSNPVSPAQKKTSSEERRRGIQLALAVPKEKDENKRSLTVYTRRHTQRQPSLSREKKKSLTLYENACDLIKTSEDGLQIDPPAAILNNIGALHMTLENYERAKEYFEAAEAKLQEDLEGDLCDSKLSSYVITMRYNLARCLEHLCLFEDAEVLYKGILREQENHGL